MRRVVLAGYRVAAMRGDSCQLTNHRSQPSAATPTAEGGSFARSKKQEGGEKGKGMACGMPISGLVQGRGLRNRFIVHRGGWRLAVGRLYVQLEPHGRQTDKYRGSGIGPLFGGAPLRPL